MPPRRVRWQTLLSSTSSYPAGPFPDDRAPAQVELYGLSAGRMSRGPACALSMVEMTWSSPSGAGCAAIAGPDKTAAAETAWTT